jgi:hypothetical protein
MFAPMVRPILVLLVLLVAPIEAARTVRALIPLVPLPVPPSMRWEWRPPGCRMASATP